MKPFLNVNRVGNVVTIRMSRPGNHNAFSDFAQMEEFVDVCSSLRSDSTVNVIILTGTDSAFCAGGNLNAMRERSGIFEGGPAQLCENYRRGIQRVALALFKIEVPLIAAVNGPAIGAGLDLACICDIRVAAESATFAESFVRLGLVPGDGGAWLLPRVVGIANASMMAYTGKTIGAAKALEMGLVLKVVSDNELSDECQSLAESIASHSGYALRLTKRLLRDSQSTTFESFLELSAAYQAIAHHTSEHDEALVAYFDRRAPKFD